MRKPVLINGRFLSAPATGVQRVAEEMVRAVDRLVAKGETPVLASWELFAPPNINRRPVFSAIRFVQGGKRSGVAWEQLDFGAQAQRGTLLNLCNVGPLFASDAVVMIHDAQVYTMPASYSRGFRLYYKLIQPFLAHRYRLVLTVSEFSRQELIKYKVAPATRIKVVHNGVDHILNYDSDPEILKTLRLASRGYVLSLANTQAHKNIRVLIEAFKSPALAGIKLVLFGGAKAEALGQLGAGPLPENVIIAGKVSDPALKALMEQALCLGFPSRTEGFGLPPLEAMLLGCPAVVAPCGSLPEVCGEAALYADPDKPRDWVEKIVSLRNDQALWSRLSRESREQAEKFSWDRAARKLIDVLT